MPLPRIYGFTDLAIVSTSQMWMQYVPVARFMRALFLHACRQAFAYLFAGPLLVVEQLKHQLAIIHEAQRARGVPLDESWYQRLRAMPALIVPRHAFSTSVLFLIPGVPMIHAISDLLDGNTYLSMVSCAGSTS